MSFGAAAIDNIRPYSAARTSGKSGALSGVALARYLHLGGESSIFNVNHLMLEAASNDRACEMSATPCLILTDRAMHYAI